MEGIYVKVVAEFDTDGNITPLKLVWENGLEYEISHILGIKRAASQRAGATGYRYEVLIESRRRYIWLEDVVFQKTIGARWFVEPKG